MKLALLLLILLLPASVTADEKISKEKFDLQGKNRTYYLFVPASAKTAPVVSLVVLLHGSGRNGLSLVEKWKDLASKEGFIIVGPDASNNEGWRMPEDAPEFIYELVEMLVPKYSVEPHHIYLFGHSAGAVLALNLAMLESEYFAAVAVHAPRRRENVQEQGQRGGSRRNGGPLRRRCHAPLRDLRRAAGQRPGLERIRHRRH